MTAWHMLRRAEINSSDIVLIPGITGDVGVSATQLVDIMGTHIIYTSFSKSKLDQLSILDVNHLIQAADADNSKQR